MRAFIAAACLLMASHAMAQTTPSPSPGTTEGATPRATSPADLSSKSYVNPQSSEAPANDNTRDPNYGIPKGAEGSDAAKAKAKVQPDVPPDRSRR